MKKFLLSIFVFASVSLSAIAQSPEGFKYQAVVRNASNFILANQAVGLRVIIQQGYIGGTSVYSETFTVTTNANGLVNVEIGNGSVLSGTFASINWANGPYFIETAVDVAGGTAYSVIGTSQLMSVPYALYAKTSGNGQGPVGPAGPAGANGAQGPQGVPGPTGSQGPAGNDGSDGATGPIGPQGPAGNDGSDGATGPIGPQGPAGNDGSDGATGPIGPQGPAGNDGSDGATGPIGPQGPAGNDGSDGATGPAGPQGPAGNDGSDGATGPMGPQGPAGFVSLNGATGTTQTYTTGTSGSDFTISTSSNVHTFNIPNAGAAARGVVSTGTQTLAGAKTFTGNLAATSKMVVGNSTVTTGAILDVNSTAGTFLAPRMTTTQRDALVSVPDGSMIINTTDKKAQIAFTTTAANIDQSTMGAFAGVNMIATGQTMGQTFTAVYSASVTQIGFYHTYRNGLTGSITSCKVYNGYGGALLATSASTSTLDNGNNTHLFTFSGLNLVASQSYYVEFTMTYSGGFLYTYAGTSYAGGTAYINNAVSTIDLPFQIFHPASVTTWDNLH